MAPQSSLALGIAALPLLLTGAAGRKVEYYRYKNNLDCENTGDNVFFFRWDSGGYDYCVRVTEDAPGGGVVQWSFDMRCEDGNSQITVRRYPDGDTSCSGSDRTEYSAPTNECLTKSSEHEWIPAGDSEFWLCEEDNPCFAKDTTYACKLTHAHTDIHTSSLSHTDELTHTREHSHTHGHSLAQAAFNACFGNVGVGGNGVDDDDDDDNDGEDEVEGGERVSVAQRVLMSELRAGDLVLSQAEGKVTVTRVIVNEHLHSSLSSRLLLLRHAEGTLSLTPDHVMLIDGDFKPARMAVPGSRLTKADGAHVEVEEVTVTRGGIINPITADGKILAADAEGAPVVAATGREWIADVLLSGYPQYTLAFNLAKHFPQVTQAYYDAWLEPFFNSAAPRLAALKAAAPAPAVVAGVVVGDAVLSAGLAAYVLCRIEVAVAVGVVYVFARAAKAARRG